MTTFADILDEPDEDAAVTETSSTATTETVAVVDSGAADVEAAGIRGEDAPDVEAGKTDNAPASASPAEVQLPEGYKRDEKGRVHRPDGTIASKEEVASFPTAPPQPVAVAEPPAPVAETPTPEPLPEPFVIRGDGQKIPVPHSELRADGSLVVKPEGVAYYRQMLAQGVAHQGSWQREKQQYDAKLRDAEARASSGGKKYNDAAVLLWDHLTNQEWLASAVAQPERIELLRDKLDVLLQRADLTIPRQPEAPQVDDAQLETDARSALNEEVEDLLDLTPNAKALFSADERKEIIEAFQEQIGAYVVKHEGKYLLDRHVLKRAFDREVAKQQRVHATALKAAEDAKKAREAAAFNAANKPNGATPPTPSRPKPVAVPTVPTGAPTKSWDQRVSDIWKDEEDE